MSRDHNAKLNSELLEQHLRRELEDGNITWNDFERTKRFFSVNYALHTMATAATISGASLYYGLRYRKPPLSWPTLWLITPLAFVVGTFPGIGLQLLAARRFQKGLEDERSVAEALGRVRHDIVHSLAVRQNGHVASEPEGDQSIDPSGKQDRWAELRKASASVSNSTWDKIRQSHERMEISSPQPDVVSETEEPAGLHRGNDQQIEQAKFDALLEAERKMSS